MLRSAPAIEAEPILVIPHGGVVTLTWEGAENGYVTVDYGGVTGWAYADLLAETGGTAPPGTPSVAAVTDDGVAPVAAAPESVSVEPAVEIPAPEELIYEEPVYEEPAPVATGCDPSYPDFCIPPEPPDLNCDDVGADNFTVLPPDPHDLDDGDGIGCEL